MQRLTRSLCISMKYYLLCKLKIKLLSIVIWNIAQHKNLSDAFLLRLFKGNIVKVANVDDNRIADLFDGKEAIIQSLKVEQDLIEWEAALWEY